MTTWGLSLWAALRMSVCLCVCVWVILSSGFSATIITSCGLITTLPKKSHDLKVITWQRLTFPPSPSPHCSFYCGNHGNGRLKPVCDTRLHFVWGEFFRVQVVSGGKMEVGLLRKLKTSPLNTTMVHHLPPSLPPPPCTGSLRDIRISKVFIKHFQMPLILWRFPISEMLCQSNREHNLWLFSRESYQLLCEKSFLNHNFFMTNTWSVFVPHPLDVLMSTGCSPVWTSTLMVAFTSPAARIPLDAFGSDSRVRLLVSIVVSGLTRPLRSLQSIRLSVLGSAVFCPSWSSFDGNTKGNGSWFCSSSFSSLVLVLVWPSCGSTESGFSLDCSCTVVPEGSSLGFLLSFSDSGGSAECGAASLSSALFWLRVWRTASSDIPCREGTNVLTVKRKKTGIKLQMEIHRLQKSSSILPHKIFIEQWYFITTAKSLSHGVKNWNASNSDETVGS